MAKKKQHSNLETFDIPNRVIFSAGIHNGDMYEEADLAEMERAFNECKGLLRPPLKLGHNEIQELWQNDGMPAIGWIDNVKKVGTDLVADFIKVPKAIYELIQAGAYRTVSAEIYWNFVCGEKKYPYALKALALLGADIPAVKTVSDILALYNAEFAMAYKEQGDFEVKTYEGANPDKEIVMEKTPEQLEIEKKVADEAAALDAKVKADALALEEAKKALEAKTPNLEEVVAKLEGLVATLTEKKAKNEKIVAELTEKLAVAEKNYSDANAKIEAHESAKRYSELEAKVDSLIGEQKILPVQKPMVMKLLSEIPLNKTYKDGELDATVESLIFNIFKGNTVKLNTALQTDAGSKQNADDEVGQINKIAKDKGLSYKEAYKVWKQTAAK